MVQISTKDQRKKNPGGGPIESSGAKTEEHEAPDINKEKLTRGRDFRGGAGSRK